MCGPDLMSRSQALFINRPLLYFCHQCYLPHWMFDISTMTEAGMAPLDGTLPESSIAFQAD